MSVVSYRDLLAFVNKNPVVGYQGPKFDNAKAQEAVGLRKIIFHEEMPIEYALMLLLEKIVRLPAHTLFSVGSLVQSHSKGAAIKLGHMLSKHAEIDKHFQAVTAYTGCMIYRRTVHNHEYSVNVEIPLMDSGFTPVTLPTRKMLYSSLVTEDSRKHSVDWVLSALDREAYLREHRAVFSEDMTAEEALVKFMAKVKSLPAGTIFSQRALIHSHSKGVARNLSRLVVEESRKGEHFFFRHFREKERRRFYCRTNMDPHLMRDFEVYLDLNVAA